MVKNHRLAAALHDAGWGEIDRQLEYKGEWYGRTVIRIDRWTPTTTPCSTPGCTFRHPKGGLPLSVREWTCPLCGITHDRDVNAAKNILAAGHAVIRDRQAVPVHACGAPGRPTRDTPARGTAQGENHPQQQSLKAAKGEKQEDPTRGEAPGV